MPLSVLPSYLYYCFVSGITPGPANLTSFSTAIRLGRRPALRQWTGLFTGFFLIAMLSVFVIYFIGSRCTEYIRMFVFIGAAYIVWLAIHILRSSPVPAEGEPETPERKEKRGFREGTFLFGLITNLTNVKIMVFCLTALAGFVLPYTASFGKLLLWGCTLPFTGPVCNLVWLFLGSGLQKLFLNHRRLLNALMAVSLIGCAVYMVLSTYF